MFEDFSNLTPNESKVFLTLAKAEVQSANQLLSPTKIRERTGLFLSDVSHALKLLKEKKIVEEDTENHPDADARVRYQRLATSSPEAFFIARILQSLPSPRLDTTRVQEVFNSNETIARYLHKPKVGIDFPVVETQLILGTTPFLPSTFALKNISPMLRQDYLQNCDDVTTKLIMHPDAIDFANQYEEAVNSKQVGLVPLFKQGKLKFLPIQLGTRSYCSLEVYPVTTKGRSMGKLFVVDGSSAFHFYQKEIEREPRESLECPTDSRTLFARAAEELEKGNSIRVIGPSSMVAVFRTFAHIRRRENQVFECSEIPRAGVETLTVTADALRRIPDREIAKLCLQLQDHLAKLGDPKFRVRLASQFADELVKRGGISRSLLAFSPAA